VPSISVPRFATKATAVSISIILPLDASALLTRKTAYPVSCSSCTVATQGQSLDDDVVVNVELVTDDGPEDGPEDGTSRRLSSAAGTCGPRLGSEPGPELGALVESLHFCSMKMLGPNDSVASMCPGRASMSTTSESRSQTLHQKSMRPGLTLSSFTGFAPLSDLTPTVNQAYSPHTPFDPKS